MTILLTETTMRIMMTMIQLVLKYFCVLVPLLESFVCPLCGTGHNQAEKKEKQKHDIMVD